MSPPWALAAVDMSCHSRSSSASLLLSPRHHPTISRAQAHRLVFLETLQLGWRGTRHAAGQCPLEPGPMGRGVIPPAPSLKLATLGRKRERRKSAKSEFL